jgi:hypothetical protein
VTLIRSEPPDLDRTAERRPNSQYCSYNGEIEMIQIKDEGIYSGRAMGRHRRDWSVTVIEDSVSVHMYFLYSYMFVVFDFYINLTIYFIKKIKV